MHESTHDTALPGLSKGEGGMRLDRDVLLCAPPDMLDMKVDPDGKSKGDAMESCAPF